MKITPRLPPKNGAVFTPGTTIRLEFPAQGYINTANTTIEFDVNLAGFADNLAANYWYVNFQNNISSIFDRIRVMYGSSPLEDVIHANLIVRQITEFATSNGGVHDQTSVSEGIGGYKPALVGDNTLALVHTRRKYTQGIISTAGSATYVPNKTTLGTVNSCIRRYQIQLPCGLFQQGKLIPVKYMASQFAVELTLAQPASCIIANGNYVHTDAAVAALNSLTNGLTYAVTNVNMIPEILEFDASYDAHFLQGLQSGGVPIQFSSWHNFVFNQTGSNAQLIVQERSRSVKALFAFMKLQTDTLYNDSGATFAKTGEAGRALSYQWRIGGRYFPASPVIIAGESTGLGGCEPYTELQKALNCLGDYRLSTNINSTTWNMPYLARTTKPNTALAQQPTTINTADYWNQIVTYNADSTGNTTAGAMAINGQLGGATSMGSSIFCFPISLETTSGKEISGLNAEEQSDISLMIQWAAAPSEAFNIEVFSYYDAMLVLRENNVVELIL